MAARFATPDAAVSRTWYERYQSNGTVPPLLARVSEHAPSRGLSIESVSDHQNAVEALRGALGRCEDRLRATAMAADRRPLRVPDECWNDVQTAVARLTAVARANGEYPEQVLLRIKNLTAEQGELLGRDSQLMGAIVRLCIETYFIQ
jgi:hypothetical protein